MNKDSIWYANDKLREYELYELRQATSISPDYRTGDIQIVSWNEGCSGCRVRATPEVCADGWCMWSRRDTQEFDTRMSTFLKGASRINAGNIALVSCTSEGDTLAWMPNEQRFEHQNVEMIALRNLTVGSYIAGTRLRALVDNICGEICTQGRRNVFLGTWREAAYKHCEAIRKEIHTSGRQPTVDVCSKALFTYMSTERYGSMLTHLQVGCSLLGIERGVEAICKEWNLEVGDPHLTLNLQLLIEDMTSEIKVLQSLC